MKKEFDIFDAIKIATIAHDGQMDKSGIPYIAHPLRVMARFENPILQMIAVLHDVIEDTHYSAQLLHLEGVPERVIHGVVSMTHNEPERRTIYYDRVKANPDALAVKYADIADNTNPERMKNLDEHTRDRLMKKYIAAVAYLDGRAETA